MRMTNFYMHLYLLDRRFLRSIQKSEVMSFEFLISLLPTILRTISVIYSYHYYLCLCLENSE